MKYLPGVAVALALLSLIFSSGVFIMQHQLNSASREVVFKLGVAYGEEARADARYADCHTVGELADLAWQLYNEENKDE